MYNNISAIIITFNPKISVLNELIVNLKHQVDNIIVVDNASKNANRIREIVDLGICYFSEINNGIAFAQNVGIEKARELGSVAAVFFDQDSLPGKNLVQELISAKQSAEKNGIKVATVGPFYCDVRTGNYSHYVSSKFNNIDKISKVVSLNVLPEYQECDFIISSGSLVELDVFLTVGKLNESLFIDAVDIEWCYRALSLGFTTIVASNATMLHEIGDDVIKFFGHEFTVNSPIRSYYYLRNMLYLTSLPYVPFIWKRKYLSKLIVFSLVSGIIYPNKIKRLKAIFWAVVDFFDGKLGACKHNIKN
jgi:rhamnosyltransferase